MAGLFFYHLAIPRQGTPMQSAWLVLAIASTVGYHLTLRLTPPAVNPLVTLAVSYAVVAATLAGAAMLVPDGMPLRDSLRQVNWTALALALAIIGIDLGFLLLYRSGFEVSLGLIVTQATAAILLMVLGVAVFSERISLVNAAGIVLCVAGLWLVGKR